MRDVKCSCCEEYRNEWCEKVVDSPHPDILRDCQYFNEAKTRWIPCSERLPEENMWTICQNNAGAMMIGKYDIAFGWMFPAYFDGIVAWMPVPELYKEEQDEQTD